MRFESLTASELLPTTFQVWFVREEKRELLAGIDDVDDVRKGRLHLAVVPGDSGGHHGIGRGCSSCGSGLGVGCHGWSFSLRNRHLAQENRVSKEAGLGRSAS